MTLPHLKRRRHEPRRQNLTAGLTQDKVEYLARLNRDAMKKYKHHQETELLMNDIKRKQRISTYEGERDRFEAARIKGPLSREQNARLGQLKTLLGK